MADLQKTLSGTPIEYVPSTKLIIYLYAQNQILSLLFFALPKHCMLYPLHIGVVVGHGLVVQVVH